MSLSYCCKQSLRCLLLIFMMCFVLGSINIMVEKRNIYYYIGFSIADVIDIIIIILYIRYIWKEYDEKYKDKEPIDPLFTFMTKDPKIDII